MIVKIKLLKDADKAQTTATAVTDDQFEDGWINLGQVTMVVPHDSLNMLNICYSAEFALTTTPEEWERVAKLHGFWGWTEEESAQHKEDAEDCKRLLEVFGHKDSTGFQERLDRHFASADVIIAMNPEGVINARKSAIHYLESRGYKVFAECIAWEDHEGTVSEQVRGFNDLMKFAKDRGWKLAVTVPVPSWEAK